MLSYKHIVIEIQLNKSPQSIYWQCLLMSGGKAKFIIQLSHVYTGWIVADVLMNQFQLLPDARRLWDDPSLYLGTVCIVCTYVGQAMNVERQPLGHGEHLDRESARLCQTVDREPVERVVDGAAGAERGRRSFFTFTHSDWSSSHITRCEATPAPGHRFYNLQATGS